MNEIKVKIAKKLFEVLKDVSCSDCPLFVDCGRTCEKINNILNNESEDK